MPVANKRSRQQAQSLAKGTSAVVLVGVGKAKATQTTAEQRRQQHDNSTATPDNVNSATDNDDSSTDEDSSEEQDEDDDDDNSSSDSSDDTNEQEDNDDETTQRLQALLLKAKESARLRAQQQQQQQTNAATAATASASNGDNLADNDELVLFGQDDEDNQDETDAGHGASTVKASTSTTIVPRLLAQPLRLSDARPAVASRADVATTDKGKAKAKGTSTNTQPVTLAQSLGGGGIVLEGQGTKTGDRWGRAPIQTLSKKQFKARQPKTAGPQWFDMPATEVTPEVKREIQAMRLRNALDPKRFYKGSSKQDKKMPEFFQMGHVIESNQSASTGSPSIARKRTFVEELVDDEQSKAYAKKKTSEIMAKHMSGRKGGNRRGANKKAKRR
ncbi:hypothetical protein ACM66B_006779 [Microbotryomycetes sp. NB124-2]